MEETETTEYDDLDLQVFALCMREEGAIEYFDKYLPVDDVGKPRGLEGLSELYSHIKEYYQTTGAERVDSQGFKSWLETRPQLLNAIGGEEGLRALLKPALEIELSTPKAVASLLRQRSQQERKRQLVEHLQETVSNGHDPTDVSRLLDQIRSLNTDPIGSISESVYTGHDMARRVDELYELPDFLSTPFPQLNKALSFNEDGGLSRGCVYSIVAASGCGKSSLGKAFMLDWVRNQKNVLFVNYEEAQDHWEKLFFTHITHHNAYTIHKEDQELQDKTAQTYIEEMKKIGDHMVVQHNPETTFFEDLEQWIRNISEQRREEGLPFDAVIIDTLQSLFMKQGNGAQRWSQFEVMMVRLEKLAKELDVAIIVTAQENNNRIKEKREVVEQSDIGGSATIVQKSTAVMVLIKKDVMDDPELDSSIVEVQIPKNRITGESYTLEPPLLRFDEASKSFEAVDINSLKPQDEDLSNLKNLVDFFT